MFLLIPNNVITTFPLVVLKQLILLENKIDKYFPKILKYIFQKICLKIINIIQKSYPKISEETF